MVLSSVWSWVVTALVVIGAPNLPFVWHLRLLYFTLRAVARGKLRTFDQEVTFSGRVWFSDCDLNAHMNNSVYNSVADFGRYMYIARLFGGLPKYRVANGGVSFWFRRELKPLAAYTVTSRVRGYDAKWLLLDQVFRTKDGAVAAHGFSKLVFKQGRKTVPPADVLRELGYKDVADELDNSEGSGFCHALRVAENRHTSTYVPAKL